MAPTSSRIAVSQAKRSSRRRLRQAAGNVAAVVSVAAASNARRYPGGVVHTPSGHMAGVRRKIIGPSQYTA